nr:hypothetical protein [Tanacetum cinerariifolium]
MTQKHGVLYVRTSLGAISSSLCKKMLDKARQAPGRRFLKEGKL